MAQLSRPYQIALGAIAVLALVWAVALRGHSSNPSQPAPSSPPSTPASTPAPGAPSKIYHGPAPGVEGLTRAIAKAHGAVATSESNARQLSRASARASGEAASPTPKQTTAGTSAGGRLGTRARKAVSSQDAASSHKKASSRTTASSHKGSSHSSGRSSQQLEVEHELAHGKTVLLLFWEPKSSVDNTVRSQVLDLGKRSKGKVAVHTALADQVGLFGTVTEVAHVYQTPTILIVGRHGLITTLTGLVDTFSLRQAVREAERVNR
ncbi:MAG: hypothetical protein ACTHM1_09470 [Solirubrobacteraceae bacterium]